MIKFCMKLLKVYTRISQIYDTWAIKVSFVRYNQYTFVNSEAVI